MSEIRQLPDPDDPELAPFWEGTRRGELRIPRCRTCGRFVWYPQPVCPGCAGVDFGWERVSGRARLFTWVTVRRAFLPAFDDVVPFLTALVALEEDPAVRLATRLDCPVGAPLRLNLPLEVAFERVDDRLTLPKFRLAEEA